MPYLPQIAPPWLGGYDADPAKEADVTVLDSPEVAQTRAEEWDEEQDEEEYREWFEAGAGEDDEQE